MKITKNRNYVINNFAHETLGFKFNGQYEKQATMNEC